MITEQATLIVDPAQAGTFVAAMRSAQAIIARQPGFRSLAVLPAMEKPGQFLLLVEWDDIESHRSGFRQSADYSAWQKLLHGYYAELPAVTYYGKSIFDA